jgi:ferredoxin
MGDDGPAEVYLDVVPIAEEASVIEAQEGCPVSVISVD